MKTIIINPIRTDFIERNLETLWKYNDMEATRVVVIDQTKAGVYDKVGDKAHLYLRPQVNLGFAKSMNEGMIHALYWGSEYVICSNDDVEYINERWWNGILEAFNQFDNVMCVNPSSLMDRNAEPRIPYKENYTEEEYTKLVEEGNGSCIDGICMWMPVFPASVLKKIGLFDEKFYPGGGEDYDMNGRIYKAGGRAIGTTLSWMWHWWGMSQENRNKSVVDVGGADLTKRGNVLSAAKRLGVKQNG